MGEIFRTMRRLVAVVLTCAIGILPSCGTMGGGGMRYLVPDSTPATAMVAS